MATIKNVRVDAKSLEGFEIETTARQFKATIDQPVSGGGKDAGPNPMPGGPSIRINGKRCWSAVNLA